MGKRPRRRHIPKRTCVACRAVRARRDLARVVRTPEGEVVLDETGKRNGRGAYVCRQRACWEKALTKGQLARALKVALGPEIMSELRAYAADLPQSLAMEPEHQRE